MEKMCNKKDLKEAFYLFPYFNKNEWNGYDGIFIPFRPKHSSQAYISIPFFYDL